MAGPVMWGQPLTELFERGGPVMWPLLLCSIVSVAIVFERTLVFLGSQSRFDRLLTRIKRRMLLREIDQLQFQLAAKSKPLPQLAASYLDFLNNPAVRDRVVTREASQHLARLETRLSWLATLAKIAPLLGLLGTVAGLVTAFAQVEMQGGRVTPDDLASGIWSALLTTVVGLTIAIPTLIAYHVFETLIARLELQFQWLLSYLDEWTHDFIGPPEEQKEVDTSGAGLTLTSEEEV